MGRTDEQARKNGRPALATVKRRVDWVSPMNCVDITIAGIPCLAEVTHFVKVKGSYSADSDWDFYGYTEIEYTVRDRTGYRAPWLEQKLTDRYREEIERVIDEAHS